MYLMLPPRKEVTLPAEEGYDRASAWYDNWHWTKFWQRNELPITAEILDRLPVGDALDAGSGTGAYRFALETRGHQTVALDISRKMLEVQEEKGGLIRAVRQTLVHGDIQAMPSSWSEAFDCICCARVLSHVDDCGVAIKELSRVLKPGGRLIITDVDPGHPYTRVTVKNGIVYSRIRVFKHSHSELAGSMCASGLQIQTFRQMGLRDLLWKPDREQFPQIYSAQNAAIFYIYVLFKE